ncbi:MAG: TldD/PmbA family protein [Candidatus Latescibacterota bacterium]
MKDLCMLALDTAQSLGASYADIRIIETRREGIETKNEQVASTRRAEDLGFGIRVIANGSWGFAASFQVTREGIERMAAQAVAIARASARVHHEAVRLAPEPAHVDIWKTPVCRDPFDVPAQEKIDLLLRINEELMRTKGVKLAQGYMNFVREQQTFASTEGSFIEQDLTRSGVGYTATAVGNEDVQKRSYPASFRGLWMGKGYELIDELPLLGNAEQTAQEAVALLTADQCPPGDRDLILCGDQLALQIHESVGHPTELDRVLGMEANYAGTSFATVDKLKTLRYGSPMVTIVADSTVAGGLATVGYDDEGVQAQKWPLIENGMLVNYLTSRETAGAIGESRSRGAMRADGWARIPMIRMTNISLMPNEGTLNDLIVVTDDGVLMSTNRSWSIDQKRINFQFGCEIGWEIKKGKKARLLKNPTYQGSTTEFWGSCDFICGESEFVLWGVANCGKGQPGQTAEMSHGAAPARFRKTRVGVGYDA